MRKREFLRRLGDELSHLDREERNDILDYYDELIEDTIEKTGQREADVIYDLGEIEDIARRVDPSYKRKIRYEEEEDRPRRESRRITREYEHRNRREERTNSGAKTGIGIVLLICLFPVWIVLFSCLFAAMLTIIGVGVGCFAGGIVCIWNGSTLFATSWAHAVFRIGIGVTLIGIILIVGPLLLKIVSFIGHIVLSVFRWLFGGRRRNAYEN
ncbi:MAG: DUF1700 domain-containing protein [Anaeroplasmataceae bacterium]|nr:DUF1700 domain-containing protein [Anaeroplasmataceae bacterium]